MSLTPLSSLLWEKWKFSLYSDDVLTKREAFSLPHFLTNFLLFSLVFSPGSCPNGLATCSSYSPRNVARYKRCVKPWFPHLNPNTAAILCSGWRKESNHVEVKVAAWIMTLPLCGEQSLDKERDIKGINSDARVLKASFGRRELNTNEWKWMKRIILENSSFPLFGSFNGGNGKSIPLFGSLSGRE